jgi:hypothetical protein
VTHFVRGALVRYLVIALPLPRRLLRGALRPCYLFTLSPHIVLLAPALAPAPTRLPKEGRSESTTPLLVPCRGHSCKVEHRLSSLRGLGRLESRKICSRLFSCWRSGGRSYCSHRLSCFHVLSLFKFCIVFE